MTNKKYAGVVVLALILSLANGNISYAQTQNASEEVVTFEKSEKELSYSAGFGSLLDNLLEKQENVTIEDEQSPKEKTVQEESFWGYRNLGLAHVDNYLNVRKEPSESGKIIGKMTKNAACEILSVENGWAKIKSGKVEGYCSAEYLYMGTEAVEQAKGAVSLIAVVNTETLKVRSEANTDCAVITLIPREERLEVNAIMDNGWVQFMLDDEEAYVSGEYVDVREELDTAVSIQELTYGQGISDTRVSLVEYAKQFIGNPYVWGGTSLTNGADCSGYTMSIFKKYGVNLPHHAASQAQLGKKVTLAEAQPGDLVFYDKNGSINHVGIYIGNGQIVHASTPKTGIRISNVNYRTPAVIKRYL